MKVFSNFKNQPAHAASGKGKKSSRAERPSFSDSEIRERLAKALNKPGTKAAAPNIAKGKQVSEFMSGKPGKVVKHQPQANKATMTAEQAEGKAKDLILKPDVDKNDPNDPAVQGKLKSILKMGSFNFSDKEKSALSRILGMGKNS